jgi:TRAP-type C4-dicarboxylate transport system permease small subunit
MASLIKKITAFAVLALMACGFFVPISLAQGNGLFDTLDTIKTQVGEGDKGIKIVDFSQGRVWGNLPLETQALIKKQYPATFKNDEDISLDAIIHYYKSDANQDKDLVVFIQNNFDYLVDAKKVPNQDGKRLISEIAYQGESQLQAVILAVAKVFRNLMGSIAVIFIVVSGILMVFAQGDEAKISEQKRSITYAIIGLAVILIIERLISAIYGVPGGENLVLTKETASQVDFELYGLISYIKAIIGSVAIFMIVLSGIRTVTSQGEEEQVTTQRKAILWTIVGLGIILVNQVVVENIFIKPIRENAGQIQKTNVDTILGAFGKVTQFILGFVGLVAFAALIYGGASMVANFGNEEAVAKAKKIIMNAIIGIIIILSAFAIVSTMIL